MTDSGLGSAVRSTISRQAPHPRPPIGSTVKNSGHQEDLARVWILNLSTGRKSSDIDVTRIRRMRTRHEARFAGHRRAILVILLSRIRRRGRGARLRRRGGRRGVNRHIRRRISRRGRWGGRSTVLRRCRRSCRAIAETACPLAFPLGPLIPCASGQINRRHNRQSLKRYTHHRVIHVVRHPARHDNCKDQAPDTMPFLQNAVALTPESNAGCDRRSPVEGAHSYD
jgi:hypothetical protein